MKYVTHAGMFHADEVIGFAICKMAGLTDQVVRVTSTQPEDLQPLLGSNIIADIGRVYDPDNLQFDHHQELLRRPNGVTYATAGLLWKQYGSAICSELAPDKWQEIADHVDKVLFEGIDTHDADSTYSVKVSTDRNEGIQVHTLSAIIRNFNSFDYQDHGAQLECFGTATGLAMLYIKRMVLKARVYLEDTKDWEQHCTYVNGDIAVLSKDLPWQELLPAEINWIVSPSRHPGNPWSLFARPVEPFSRELRYPIERPDWFTGFIHNGKWIAGAETSDQAVALALSQYPETNEENNVN